MSSSLSVSIKDWNRTCFSADELLSVRCRGTKLCRHEAGDEHVLVLAAWKLPTPKRSQSDTH